MKYKIVFAIFFLFFLAVHYFHFRIDTRSRQQPEKHLDDSLSGFLSATPVSSSTEAMECFELGLRSSTTSKKIKYFTKALELDPGMAEVYAKRGMLHYFQGQYDKVIQDFQKYVDAAPGKAEAYLMLGIGYLKSGMLEPAISNFTRAIELAPNLDTAYANRAEAYRLDGKYEKAIRDASRAIDLKRNQRTRADAYTTRGKTYRKIGRIDLAVDDFRAAWALDPRIPQDEKYFGFQSIEAYTAPESN